MGSSLVGSATERVHPDALWARRPLAAVAALAALCASTFCFITGENLPVGLLPEISRNLHASLGAAGLLVTIYAATVVLATVPLTHLTRHLPRRYLLAALLGTFSLFTLGAAGAPGYGWLVAGRFATALAQAVFWAVTPVTAASLFPPEKSGRAVAGMMAGNSLAVVGGVPAATWLGQHAGWRAPFVVLSGIGALALVIVVRLVPTEQPGASHAASGTRPNRRACILIIVTTVLAVAGTYTTFTYITAFFTKVSGLALSDTPAALLVVGVTSAIGVGCVSLVLDRWPRGVTVGSVALMTIALFGLYASGSHPDVAVGFQALEGFGLSAGTVCLQTRVLLFAPSSTDMATAWYSTSFNVGIASGPAIGGLVLTELGLRTAPLVGGLLLVAALGVLLGERLTGLRSADPALTSSNRRKVGSPIE